MKPAKQPAKAGAGAVRRTGRSVLVGDKSVLRQLTDSDVQLAIWERSLPDGFASWIADLPAAILPNGRILAHLDQLEAGLGQVFRKSKTPLNDHGLALLTDIAMLAHEFARIPRSDTVDVRIEPIFHDACWKFHRDNVDARMVTTYRGPGTQWVLPKDSARALHGQKAFSGVIRAFSPHAVGLFRGDRHQSDRGTVHRSPPIAGTGEVRLFLCINLPSEAFQAVENRSNTKRDAPKNLPRAPGSDAHTSECYRASDGK
jgi:Protein of unknown function (DUF1826)